ncbi:hypothetical protein BB560_004605 [Smittium megazygosporum]|uniref:Uncharacterized protein n=1 Tax=Smittium megazygosporum TaxID=133381 RepID=A0A2T9Z8W4_9FUNG|nr:hypothetical protein BB560_004605 [Smittium megazygosporum]
MFLAHLIATMCCNDEFMNLKPAFYSQQYPQKNFIRDSLLQFQGPKTPFYRRFRYDQSQAAKYFFEVADRISNNDASSLFNYVFFRLYYSSNLKSMIFSFGAEEYILAKWKIEKERFGLNEYQRHVHASTAKISDYIKSNVRQILLERSNNSSVIIELRSQQSANQF